MNRQNFFIELNLLLKKMPAAERQQALNYYEEIIDDTIEDGFTEEEAVSRLGDINALAESIYAEHENSLPVFIPARRRRSPLTAVLLVLGFPVWGSLLLAAFALFLSVIVLICVPPIVFAVLTLAFLAASLVAILGSFLLMGSGILQAVFQLGIGIIFLGLSALSFIAFYYSLKGTAAAFGGTFNLIKNKLHRKRTEAVL